MELARLKNREQKQRSGLWLVYGGAGKNVAKKFEVFCHKPSSRRSYFYQQFVSLFMTYYEFLD